MENIWNRNKFSSILFNWISFLQNEIFNFLNIDPTNIVIYTSSSNSNSISMGENCAINYMKSYNQYQEEQAFQRRYFNCAICFEVKFGKFCIKFDKCEHVFCTECMKGYFENKIKDCDVHLLCPENKCESQANQSQVIFLLILMILSLNYFYIFKIIRVVGIELFNKHDSILLRNSLNNMHDIVYCPRSYCQCAVIPVSNEPKIR